jgi:hypothetical protein
MPNEVAVITLGLTQHPKNGEKAVISSGNCKLQVRISQVAAV